MHLLSVEAGEAGSNVVFVGLVIDWVLWIFLLILFARMILSWVPVLVRDWQPRGPMLVFAEIIYSITDPPLRPAAQGAEAGPGGQHDARPGLHRAGHRGQHPDADQPEHLLLSFRRTRRRDRLTSSTCAVAQTKLGTVVRMGVAART